MHDAIAALHGQWVMFLCAYSCPTLPLLKKVFMDLENEMVIVHMHKEVLDFKKFIKVYIPLKKSKLL